jgi:hypothetical protein
MDMQQILDMIYVIQGIADPNQPQDLASFKQRMQEIWEMACEIMDRTGYQPD